MLLWKEWYKTLNRIGTEQGSGSLGATVIHIARKQWDRFKEHKSKVKIRNYRYTSILYCQSAKKLQSEADCAGHCITHIYGPWRVYYLIKDRIQQVTLTNKSGKGVGKMNKRKKILKLEGEFQAVVYLLFFLHGYILHKTITHKYIKQNPKTKQSNFSLN